MSHYIDTSAIVAALVEEPHSERVLQWLGQTTPGSVFVSDWTHVEVSSALSIKIRTGELATGLGAETREAWHRLHSSNFPTLAVTSEHFEAAARLAAQHELGLRAADALHVAIAREGSLTLVTLDATMANAALQLGVPVEAV